MSECTPKPAPPLTIHRVQNGWVVEPMVARACNGAISDQHVFESWGSFMEWLDMYYNGEPK